MVRPVGAFLLVFALLSLIVHQIGMFEILGAVGTVCWPGILRWRASPRLRIRPAVFATRLSDAPLHLDCLGSGASRQQRLGQVFALLYIDFAHRCN